MSRSVPQILLRLLLHNKCRNQTMTAARILLPIHFRCLGHFLSLLFLRHQQLLSLSLPNVLLLPRPPIFRLQHHHSQPLLTVVLLLLFVALLHRHHRHHHRRHILFEQEQNLLAVSKLLFQRQQRPACLPGIHF